MIEITKASKAGFMKVVRFRQRRVNWKKNKKKDSEFFFLKHPANRF